MPVERYFPYRGDITAAVGVGGTVAFVTRHVEGQPTAVYRLDVDRLALSETALPCGGVALAADASTLYVAGTDRRAYKVEKAPKPLGEPFADAIVAILPVSGDRLAVVAGKHLALLSRGDGSLLQSLELPEAGTCLAADKTGQWLAVGTAKGTVAVFDGQDKAEFEAAEAEKLHDGAVTALLFEPEELRFFSAGADHKLLSTFARGRLEPEDKGRGNNHEDIVTVMLAHDAERFLTGSRDATIKNWPRVGGIKPSTLKENVGRVVAIVKLVASKPMVVAACDDNSLRVFWLTDDGRLDDDCKIKAYGAMDWAKNELAAAHDSKRREKALKALWDWNDAASLELIAKQIERDSDPALKVQAAKILGWVQNPRAVTLLEPFITHADGKVRVQVFEGLANQLGKADFKPIDLALKTNQADIGVLAVKALEPLAKADDQALARLTSTLNAPAWDVRKAALAALEAVFEPTSPQASLVALASAHGDLRALALGRAFDRGLLADARVQSAIRRRLEDDDTGVRKVAFLLSVLSRPKLAEFLRSADGELHRQLNEIEKSDKAPPKVSAKVKLDDADYDTLLQATASRALDTCLRGAKGLALLRDPRAFALLLQLSREENTDARVEVCRALAALGDPRAVNRLNSLLYDSQASVRDAAYSAVAKLNEKTPLAAAEAGLAAGEPDVRRRALQTLLDATKAGADGRDLLVRAINDPAPTVRSEAFKAVLNQKVAGGGEATLRFARQSIHADVRKDVLTEVIAQAGEPWATPFLYEFLDDPDADLRGEAFAAATRKTKELAPLEAALKSKFADVRTLAVDGFIKKHTPAAQAFIVQALADADTGVRRLALSALIDDEAREALTAALRSEHADVRVRAAAALGRLGDPAAVGPLLALATVAEPVEEWKKKSWAEAAETALAALAEIGDPQTLKPVLPLLESPHANLRTAAGTAAMWAARPGDEPALRGLLSHTDAEVKLRAAFGLAYLGDASVAPIVMHDFGSLGPDAQFAAAVALGGDSRLGLFLDHPTDHLRTWAVLVQLLLELRGTTGVPSRLLACLSAKAPRIRLTAAEALEVYADPVRFRAFVQTFANDRGDEAAWKISPEVLDSLADILAFGSSQLKARTARLFAFFTPKEQAGWDKAWAVHAKRFAAEIAAAKKQAAPLTPKLSAAELRELAFGAYVGLVREQGSATATPATIRVRQTALARIFAIASTSPENARAARPILTQALGDPNQPVRMQAFEHLLALNLDKTALAADALEAGHTDLGVKGLGLLTDGTTGTDGDAVLERVLLSRTDDLAVEAAKLLAKTKGQVPVAAISLDAVSEKMRQQAVTWLAAEYDKNADAQKQLRKAVESRYRHVRQAAAIELATKKDPAAFDVLATMLKEATDAAAQKKIVDSMVTLGDGRAVGALLDRAEHDPTGTALASDLFVAAGGFRKVESADRLLKMAEKKEWRAAALDAARVVSGFDQNSGDPDEEAAFAKTEQEQRPRHPDVLGKLLDKALALGDTGRVSNLLPAARCSRGPAVDPVLATLAANPDADLRLTAVITIGWRLRKRNGPPDALLKALRHKDPTTQFAAAEGLARGGRAEGLQVLLSSLEYLEDVAMRRNAVLALGELADPRAVDVLLKFANENGHALQETAAEALGHLRKSPRGDEIGTLLERLAKSPMAGVAQRALVGLRWFDSPGGWTLIRTAAKSNNWRTRQTAVEQLGYDATPAGRDTVRERLRKDADNDVVNAAFDAAVRQFGPDSLEPYYAAVETPNENDFTAMGTAEVDVLKALRERGDTLRLLQTLPLTTGEGFAAVESILMSRPLPSDDVMAKALASDNQWSVKAAARMIGRAVTPPTAVRKPLEAALAKWWAEWQTRRDTMLRRVGQADEEATRKAVKLAEVALEELLWPAARFGFAEKLLAELLTARPHDIWMYSLRKHVLTSLSAVPAAFLPGLEAILRGTTAELRPLAAGLLAKATPQQAAKLAAEFFADRAVYARLTGSAKSADVAKANAAQPHYQPLALPTLIEAKDVPTLAKVARDKKAAEPARLGAVEGLGFMAVVDAEAVLAEIGAAAGDDEDVRKAAWKALRRSKRARKRFTAEGT
ncbi:HEAT repeat domain-containing protein [Limnoglobus roseus]|uniref:HEAT repeat domain-containing protein n=1 Tax=Limnoglobus roseus TaxID=2598579 RepID=A0A5C1A4N7_9BACT|nr:HEAT repeat domain-containing protein [Limnoglobus roseus]QEL13293.1 HEAT repeat domain-containing protein [Limnoglobus roseus]